MTEFYQQITQETTQEINNKINTIQNDIKTIQNEIHQYVNYIQEENLNIPTTGTHEEQVKSCETLLDRMKEIVQQKVEVNKKKEEMLKTVNEIFETSQCHEDVVDNYHDKIVFKLLDLEDEKHQNKMERIKQ